MLMRSGKSGIVSLAPVHAGDAGVIVDAVEIIIDRIEAVGLVQCPSLRLLFHERPVQQYATGLASGQ